MKLKGMDSCNSIEFTATRSPTDITPTTVEYDVTIIVSSDHTSSACMHTSLDPQQGDEQ